MSWKEEKALKLFEEQEGLCWICEQPMLKPNFYKSPNRWMANIDHLVEKRKEGDHSHRPIKVAHMICNSSRHHLPVEDPKIIEHIAWMKKRFSNQKWWNGVLKNVERI